MGIPTGGKEITDNIVKHLDRNYLNSIDLMGIKLPVELTIKKVEHHETLKYNNGNTDRNAMLLFFEETPKPLKLNVTNIKAIILKLKTGKVADWKGKKIKLTVKEIRAFGKMTPAVRVV